MSLCDNPVAAGEIHTNYQVNTICSDAQANSVLNLQCILIKGKYKPAHNSMSTNNQRYKPTHHSISPSMFLCILQFSITISMLFQILVLILFTIV